MISMSDSDRFRRRYGVVPRAAAPIRPGVAEPQRERGHAEHHERQRGEELKHGSEEHDEHQRA